MLVSHYQLEGEINLVKEIPIDDMIEKHYQDKNGNRSIIIMKDLHEEK